MTALPRQLFLGPGNLPGPFCFAPGRLAGGKGGGILRLLTMNSSPERRRWILTSVLCVAGLNLRAGGGQPTSEPRGGSSDVPQNVVLVTIDTLRPDHLGCYGYKSIQTPNLDTLATRGARFSRAVACVPLTLPSHASILTGTYPPVHGVRDMGGFVLGESPPALATLLARAGFRTAAVVGSAALDHRYGLSRGFETYDDQMPGSNEPATIALPERRAGEVVDRVLAWLAARPAGRFFLWVHFFDPHSPYDPPAPYRNHYAGRLYDGEIAYTDAELGRLLDAFRRQGLDGQTLFAILGDHGESLGEHGESTHGVFLYDATVRIPLILAGPGVPAGRVVDAQVRSIDLVPTILTALKLPLGSELQGASLWPLLTGSGTLPPESRFAYLETVYPRTHFGWSELRGLRTGEWKYIQAPWEELYDLRQDPSEKQSSLRASPATAERYKSLLAGIARGKRGAEAVRTGPVRREAQQELASLGYVSAGVGQPIQFDFSRPDPKTRIKLLTLFESDVSLMSRREYALAARELERLVATDPGNPLFRLRLGISYELAGNVKAALAAYRQGVRSDAVTDEMLYRYGNLLMDAGQLETAAEVFGHALKLNPANIACLNNLGLCYFQLGRLEESERAFRAMLAEDPKAASAHNGLGLIRVTQGQRSEAAADFQKALDADPNFWEAWLNLGVYYQEEGQAQEALRCLEQFSRGAPAGRFRAELEKARQMMAQIRGGAR